MKRIERSIPYFEALLNSKTDRWKLLQSFPSFVFNDFIEVLHNIVLGQVDGNSYKKKLQKYRNTLIDMVNVRGLAAKKKILMKRFPLDGNDFGKNKRKSRESFKGSRQISQIGNGKFRKNQEGSGFVWAALIPFAAWIAKAIGSGAVASAAGYGVKKIIENVDGEKV